MGEEGWERKVGRGRLGEGGWEREVGRGRLDNRNSFPIVASHGLAGSKSGRSSLPVTVDVAVPLFFLASGVIRGYHVYQRIWMPHVGEEVTTLRWWFSARFTRYWKRSILREFVEVVCNTHSSLSFLHLALLLDSFL